jgi:hypothetical protein
MRPLQAALFLLTSACAYQAAVNPGGADQCEVYAVGAGDEPLGTVFVIGARVYLRGGVSAETAYLTETGEVLLQRDGDWVTGGTYDGARVTISAPDGTWTSGAFQAGRVRFENGELFMDFGYTSACTARDTAAGLVMAFEQVHNAALPHEPQFQ